MKNNTIKITSIIAVAMSLFAISVSSAKSNVEASALTRYTNHDAATYYSTITDSMEGTELLNKLHALNSTKRQKTVGYKAMLNNPSNGFYVTDPGDGKNTIRTFYSGQSNSGTGGLNREHVWPNSRGGSSVEDDIHMPRPTFNSENGSRGNSFYVEGKKSSTSGWDPAMESFGVESYRGDAARIIFYCAIADTSLTLVDLENDSATNKTMGKLSDLLKWNLKYPVQEREMTRNEGAESLQGNRNPFIDNPSYACRIWGNKNSTTKEICKGVQIETEPKVEVYKVENSTETIVNQGNVNLIVGNSINLIAKVDDVVSSNCNWSFEGDSVSVSNYQTNGKTINATNVGNTTLTLTYNYLNSSQVSKTITKTFTFVVNTEGVIPPDPVGGDYLPITNISSLKTGDEVVMLTKADGGKGVTGFNNSKDATISAEEADWLKYKVEANGGTVHLKNTKTGNYIQTPTANEYKESEVAGSITVSSAGVVSSNSRFLCINGSYVRFYTSIGSYTPIKLFKVDSVQPEVTLQSLTVSGSYKTNYSEGEIFDPLGITITANYSDGTTQDVTANISWDLSPLTISQTSIVVTYNGKSVSVPIVVSTKNIDEDDPLKNLGGCGGSAITEGFIYSTLAVGALGIMLVIKKKEQD